MPELAVSLRWRLVRRGDRRADGDYLLDTTVGPTARLVEELETNNCVSVRVRLSGLGTASPQAELLGIGPPCE